MSNVYTGFLVSFGWWVVDQDTDKSYWMDLRAGPEQGFHFGKAADAKDFRAALNEEAEKVLS